MLAYEYLLPVVQPPGQAAEVPTSQALPSPRVPGRSERLGSANRTQLAPFMQLVRSLH